MPSEHPATASNASSLQPTPEPTSQRADRVALAWDEKQSTHFLNAILEHLPAGLYIIDKDYHLLAVNKSRLDRLGHPTSGTIGLPCYQVLFGISKPCPECRVQESLLNGQTTIRNERRREHDGQVSEWKISTFPVANIESRVAQAIVLEIDNTEQRQLEAVLIQSEKLAAVGQLAAGVAHEINNPLTAIIANAQILHRELPADFDLLESVDLISRAGARAAQVVRNLLDFARKEEYRLGRTDLNQTIERALELIQHELLAHGVSLDLSLSPNLPHLQASADHLQSVWLNLLLNAIDSLDKSPQSISIASYKSGRELLVIVRDNGKGISPDYLARIFEPFYTTKAPGRGTGLGLSVSRRIIHQHGGSIRVESQLGEGSVFTVALPIA